MTSPVPDALRTQLAEALIAWWTLDTSCRCDNCTEGARDAADVLLPFVTDLLARARVEGAAEALREAADDTEAEGYANRPEIGSHGGGLLSAAEELRARAAALSASTTTEGDPT